MSTVGRILNSPSQALLHCCSRHWRLQGTTTTGDASTASSSVLDHCSNKPMQAKLLREHSETNGLASHAKRNKTLWSRTGKEQPRSHVSPALTLTQWLQGSSQAKVVPYVAATKLETYHLDISEHFGDVDTQQLANPTPDSAYMLCSFAEMKWCNLGMGWDDLPKVTQPVSIHGRSGRLTTFTNFQSLGQNHKLKFTFFVLK